MGDGAEATDDRRAGGSPRRIPAATSQYSPSARGRPREDSAVGGASEHRAGDRTRGDDDRGGSRQRFNGGRPACDWRARRRSVRSLSPPDISPTRPEVSTMTVKVTLRNGGTDNYMRFGDAYV